MGILKALALRILPLDQFKALLGLHADPAVAMRAYGVVRSSLPSATKNFWDSHTVFIRRGILWQGRVQRLLALVRRTLQLVGMSEVLSEFEAIQTSEEAIAFRKRYVEARPYRWIWAGILNELTYLLFSTKDARRRLGSQVSGRQFLMQRMHFALSRAPVARDFLLPQMLGYYPQGVYPTYLAPEHVDLIRERVDRIRFHTGEISEHLKSLTENSLDGVSLSNVADWLNFKQFTNVIEMSLRATRDGGRILAYSRIAPINLRGLDDMRLLIDLGKSLAATDRTGYYPHILVVETKKRGSQA